ncbi:MAG: KOW domain-containing RNA-binding protein [Oscillospiraceae bacterium]|jgi:hypothetical protein|nr:KOW domain-containing RNA-binding protein [Oscillospiraceae bacterium]
MQKTGWERGTIVQSLAGRDKGYYLCVVGEEGGMPLVCDGKERPLARPKKKNPKHLAPVACETFTWQLRGNNALRRALNQLAARGAA